MVNKHFDFVKTTAFVLLAVLSLCSSHSVAGNLFGRELTFGVKSGFSVSKLMGSDFDQGTFGKETALSYGGLILWNLHPVMQAQLEVCWHTSKSLREYSRVLAGSEIKFREIASITYLSIPLIVKFPFPTGSTSSVAPYLGSTVSMALFADLEGDIIAPPRSQLANNSYSMDISNYRSIDGGLIGGVDFQFNLWKIRTLVDLRYTRGFISAFNDVSIPVDFNRDDFPYSNHITGEQFDLKNAAFTFSIGMML